MDLHSGQCVGYFDIPVDHVYGESVILDYLASKRISTGAARKTGSGQQLSTLVAGAALAAQQTARCRPAAAAPLCPHSQQY